MIMKKAILIGNGFTSQLIKEYSDFNMKEKLIENYSKEYNYINKLFDCFRTTKFHSEDVYKYEVGLSDSNNLLSQNGRLLYNNNLKIDIISKLTDIGFQNNQEIFENYFIQYGLIFEVVRNEINSIENLLKVIDMFKTIGKIDNSMETEIKQIANKIYYNDGKYGLKDTNLQDYSKIRAFFSMFDFIFTTNYDLILDDINENNEKVFHLHGGFNFEHRNKKSINRLNAEQAYMVWGINGDEKYKELSPGWDFSNFRFDAVRYGQSLLADYFSYLEDKDYEEIHIFGFSGENDQHINNRIISNKYSQRIIYFCNPNKLNDYNYLSRMKDIFHGTDKTITIESWTKVWEQIK